MKKIFLLFIALMGVMQACKNGGRIKEQSNSSTETNQIKKPNIVIIYADDLGVGDVSSYGFGNLQTPNFDRIAKSGLRFTNGYATSATCTPSRYALLTGEYPWRKKAKVLKGNAGLIIDVNKQTLPSMLKEAGYATAVMGKWHLGLGEGGERMDWNAPILPGPNELGFDESFILASTNDRVPTVYVENHNVVGLDTTDSLRVSYQRNFPGEPTGKENPEMLKMHPSHGHDRSIHNGISRIGYMKGGKSALWIDENMADTVLVRSQQFIKKNKDRSFFLFYSLHQPHVPRVPHPRFKGQSGMGPRGDAILEADWCVGQLLDTLDELEIAENTIVVFSSDNGAVLDDGYKDDANEKLGSHTPSGPFKGGKYSLFDGGAHVPFMASWPGKIKPGISNALVCQIDLLTSLAVLTGQKSESPDSKNILNALIGKTMEGRRSLLLEARGRIAIREGEWIMIPPYEGSPWTNKWVNLPTGVSSELQLYNVKEDPGQNNNLAKEFPEKTRELHQKIKKLL